MTSLAKQLADKTRENETLWGVIAALPGHVFWKDLNGNYLGCNNNVAQVLGLSHPRAIAGLSNQDLLASKLALEADSIDKQVIDSKQEVMIEEIGFDLNKQPAVYLSRRTPLIDANNNMVGIIGISFDITDRKKMEENLNIAKAQALAASAAKSEFITNMSHDIKTPLAGIIGIAELLTTRLENENHELANASLLSSKQLLNFINQCLESATIEHDITLKTEQFQLTTILNDINDLFKSIAKSKGLAFNIHYAMPLPDHFIGNSGSIYRILLNLIGNAVKFTTKGAVDITISINEYLSQQDVILRIAIKDTGIGIAKNHQKIIFDRFTRISSSPKSAYSGCGLGLHLVQTLINSIGGKIYLRSELGHGSEFIVELPLQISSALPDTSQKPEALMELNSYKNASPIKILLIEDNAIVQHIESALLASLNCITHPVSSGEKALEVFEPGKYDLILMDIGLPEIQGDETTRIIREKEQGTPFHVPIIALTAHITGEITTHLLAAGVTAAYSKPLLHDQAVQLIFEHVTKKRLLNQL